MSRIFGYFAFDGRKDCPQALKILQDKLACGNLGYPGLWSDGSAGLGGWAWEVTPESKNETLPFRHGSGNAVITADVRLDNRLDLCRALGVSENPEEITDTALTLEAYLKWGDACPGYLLGDFAFAIWDSRRGSLFCARDHMGIKPFYYCFLKGNFFSFSSDMISLTALPAFSPDLDEEAVADYLTWNMSDKESTWYKQIRRLPPATSFTVKDGQLERARYWTPDPSRTLRFESDEAYEEAFRSLFREAVKCRLRSSYPVASHLSGGLDSSAIAAVAARELARRNERLITFSFVPSLESGWILEDERPFIETFKNQERVDSYYIHASDRSGIFDFDCGSSCLISHFELETLESARAKGVRVLLSGFGGDDLASFKGGGYFAELFTGLQWPRLWREARQRCSLTKWSPVVFAYEDIFKYLFPRAAAFMERWYFKRDYLREQLMMIQPEFARRFKARQRAAAGILVSGSSRKNRYQRIMDGRIQESVEGWGLSGIPFGIEYRYPLLDKRLLEFCLALPSEQFLQQGMGRSLFRRAMRGILPDEIRLRQSKFGAFGDFLRRLVRARQDFLIRLAQFEETGIGKKYVDLSQVRKFMEELPAEEDCKKTSFIMGQNQIQFVFFLLTIMSKFRQNCCSFPRPLHHYCVSE